MKEKYESIITSYALSLSRDENELIKTWAINWLKGDRVLGQAFVPMSKLLETNPIDKKWYIIAAAAAWVWVVKHNQGGWTDSGIEPLLKLGGCDLKA